MIRDGAIDILGIDAIQTESEFVHPRDESQKKAGPVSASSVTSPEVLPVGKGV
jgi:hypothetical protein